MTVLLHYRRRHWMKNKIINKHTYKMFCIYIIRCRHNIRKNHATFLWSWRPKTFVSFSTTRNQFREAHPKWYFSYFNVLLLRLVHVHDVDGYSFDILLKLYALEGQSFSFELLTLFHNVLRWWGGRQKHF